MPRFHLHFRNSQLDASDEEGVELADLESARARAIAGIRNFLGHEAMQGTIDFRGKIDIADDEGVVLACVPFGEAIKIVGACPTTAGDPVRAAARAAIFIT